MNNLWNTSLVAQTASLLFRRLAVGRTAKDQTVSNYRTASHRNPPPAGFARHVHELLETSAAYPLSWGRGLGWGRALTIRPS